MVYDSLMLSRSGDIIGSGSRCTQFPGTAALAIGIGGVGTAALAKLKSKIYQQITPDNPGEPIPHYDHIQFLAIDSDETDIRSAQGPARLDKSSEFFSIHTPHLAAMLGGAGKRDIKCNPVFNWMDIDSIDALLSPQGAGGVRQVGRYLLLSKASELKTQIGARCLAALHGLQTSPLDVYIFAGISGGTGGGCFLDACYIVRKALEDLGLAAISNITGFLFLPDVMTGKAAATPNLVSVLNANGYATLKELDYHMALQENGGRFQQNYRDFSVDTQLPPVDSCFLLSATGPDGAILLNGLDRCIQTTSDYVMACLAQVSKDDDAFCTRGILAEIGRSLVWRHDAGGANRAHYHLLGSASVQVPASQIAACLAAGFYRRFQACTNRDKAVVTRSDVHEWAMRLGLNIKTVYNGLVQGCPELVLPDIPPKLLKTFCPLPQGKAPQPWAECGNVWLDVCRHKRIGNRADLNREMAAYDYGQAPNGSLVGRVFCKLYELCMDPNYGPYYAAGLLNHSGYSLISAVEGCIREVEEQAATRKLQFYGNGNGGLVEEVVRCSADFGKLSILPPIHRRYLEFRDSVHQLYLVSNRLQECGDLVTTLQDLKRSLEKLYSDFFVPLLTMLDGLQDTFEENILYLAHPAAGAAANVRCVPALSDLRPVLERAVDALTPNELICGFMSTVLQNYEEWRDGNDEKIGRLIGRYMEDVFGIEIGRPLQDRLFDLYPQTGSDVNLLAREIGRDVIEPLYESALPTFSLFNSRYAFQCGILSVPLHAGAVCSAASVFSTVHTECIVQKTGLHDRVSALRIFSGVPLGAYGGLSRMKRDYDQLAGSPFSAGLHLRSRTGRGDGGEDWRELPEPASP